MLYLCKGYNFDLSIVILIPFLFQKAYSKPEPNVDVIYVSIGQAPVTCLMLLGDQLWCASGNTVAIMHAKYVNFILNILLYQSFEEHT